MFGEFNSPRPQKEGVNNETALHQQFLEVFLHSRLGQTTPGLAISENDPKIIEEFAKKIQKPTTIELTYERDKPTKLTANYVLSPEKTITVTITDRPLVEYLALQEQSSEK